MRLVSLAASLLATAAVLTATAGLAAPASAGVVDDPPFEDRADDATLDPSRYWLPEATGPGAAPSFGALRGADIRRFAGGHSMYGISAYVVTGSLKGVDTTTTLAIRTPGRVDYLLRFERTADEETSVVLLGPSGEPVDCAEPSYGWIMDDYRMTTLMTHPSCLGDPEWIRLGAATTAHAPGQRFGYADDVRHDRRTSPDKAPRIGGPRLFPYRG